MTAWRSRKSRSPSAPPSSLYEVSATKAIVTGSTGFVGSHLVERLLAEGVQVVCLTRRTTNTAPLAGLPVEFHPSDARLPDADFLFHVAGLTRGRTLAEYMAANADATARIVQAAPSNLRRFVYVSSLAAVGPNATAEPQDETVAPHPHDYYGTSKLAGEHNVLHAADRLPVTIVRPPGVYGPRDTNVLPVFRVARRFGILPNIGSRDKKFSLIHASDLAQGIWLAANAPAAVGQTYFLSGGIHSPRDFAAALSQALARPREKPIRILSLPNFVARLAGEFGQLKWALTGKPQIMSRRKIRDLLLPHWTCSTEKARRDFGFVPQFTLAAGLAQTRNWYHAEGWL
jgi:nucleoside-diphosphate-sugar epimerase